MSAAATGLKVTTTIIMTRLCRLLPLTPTLSPHAGRGSAPLQARGRRPLDRAAASPPPQAGEG
jgi:hypothetical protein